MLVGLQRGTKRNKGINQESRSEHGLRTDDWGRRTEEQHREQARLQTTAAKQSKATQHNATQHYVLVEKVPIVVEKCGHVIDCAKNNMNVRDSEVR